MPEPAALGLAQVATGSIVGVNQNLVYNPAYRQLRAAGVPISRWDWRWPDIPPLGDDHGPAWSHHVLQLACHQDLSVADRDAIITAILAHYATAS